MSFSSLKWAAFVALVVAGGAGCGGNQDSFNCSLKNPAILDEGVGQWPKFRRDRQNSGTILLDADAFATVSRSTATRELRWAFPPLDEEGLGGFVGSPVISPVEPRVVYVGSTNSRFYALGLDNGERVLVTPTPLEKSPTPGGTITPTPTPAPFEVIGDPAPFTGAGIAARRDDKDAVYVGSGGGLLFGVDDSSAPLRDIWPFALDAFVGSSAILGSDGTIYATTLRSGLFGVCPNGAIRFAALSGPSESSPAVGRDPDKDEDGMLFFGGDDRLLRALTKEGITRWVASFSAPILAAPVVALSADGSQTQSVYAVDAAGMMLKFDRVGRRDASFVVATPPQLYPVSSSPALSRGQRFAGPEGTLYAALGENLYAIDADTGAIRWQWPSAGGVGARIQSSPAVALAVDASGAAPDPESAAVIVVGADDGTLYFVRDDGAQAVEIGRYLAAGALVSSPAVAADGTIVIGGSDGHVYAVR